MRLFQVGAGWFPEEPGGLERMYYGLLRHLQALGVEIRGIVAGSASVARESGGLVESFAPPTVPLPARLWAARRLVGRALRRHTPDLVVSHFALYTFPALDLLGDRPLVVHFHGPWARESAAEGGQGPATWLKGALEGKVYRRAARLVVLSRAFGEILERDYGAPGDRVRLVPGGVDTERLALTPSREEARERLKWPAGRPLILAVRRLARRMGLENLIEAMADVRRRVPEALLVVAGRGHLGGQLEERVRARGLQDHVWLVGFLPDADLALAYRAADLTVVPSVTLEGFGLVAAESLAAGTPVLVTPVGGLPEVVAELSPALVLPSAAPASLAEGIRAALTGTLSLPPEAACRQYAQQRFAWPVVADRVRAVYEEVLR